METRFTLDDIIEDLAAVELLLLNYEKKYKVRTPDFYKLYKQGKLEERWDLIDWAGLCEIKLDREKTYETMASEALLHLPLLKPTVQSGQTFEAIVTQRLDEFMKHETDDPLLQLAGAFESELTDISERHDEYIGQSLISNI